MSFWGQSPKNLLILRLFASLRVTNMIGNLQFQTTPKVTFVTHWNLYQPTFILPIQGENLGWFYIYPQVRKKSYLGILILKRCIAMHPTELIIKSTVLSCQTECLFTVRARVSWCILMSVFVKMYFYEWFGRKWYKCRLGFQPNNTKS